MEDKIVFVNDAFLKVYGYGREELIGSHISLVRSNKNIPSVVRQILPSTLKGGWEGEIINRRKSGDDFPIHLSTSIIRDKAGKPVALVGVATDLTERKKEEKNLAQSVSILQATLDSTADGILVVNRDGRIVSYNKRFVEMWRIPKSVVEAGDDNAALGFVEGQLADREGFIAKVRELYRDPEASSFDLISFKDGRQFERYSQPQRIGNEIVGRVWSFSDITARKKAEEKYLQLFAESKDVIFISTPEGKFVDLNPAAVELFGYSSKEEMLRVNIGAELYANPEDRERYQRELAQKGFVKDYELVLKKKNGEELTVLETTTPEMDALGNVVTYRGIIRDITERKRAESALELQRTYFQQLFENSPAAIAVLDQNENVLNANRSFKEIFQYSAEELLGKNINDYVVPAFLKAEGAELSRGALSRNVVQKETKRKRKDGTLVDVGVTGYPIVIEDELVGVYAIYIDITSRRNLEESLRQAQKMESIGTLAGGIAHDFNNILTMILGHASSLERSRENPARFSQSVGTIAKAVDRGTALVRQLLTFARKSDTLFESIRLNEVIGEVVGLLRETFPKTIEISVDLGEKIPSIMGDTNQVHQILINLSVNARDAMTSGGTLKFVTRVTDGASIRDRFLDAHEDRYVHLAVQDSGVGIDEETRRRIFEPFFTTKGVGKGTGLGLAVVYGVMGSHRGYIDVESFSGRGTRFNLYFPVQPSEIGMTRPRRAVMKEIEGGSETLLIVEDEEILRELVQESLSEKGYNVLTCSDGEEAIEIFKKRRGEIALVLSDMGLPKMGGYELFQRLKSMDPSVKLILASGYLEPNLKSEILKAGAKDFIQKPYSPEQIQETIRRLLDEGKE